MENRLGYIISNIYNGVNKMEEIEYQSGKYHLKMNATIIDGVFCFDERKTHVVNLSQILDHYYHYPVDVQYHELGVLKQRRNALDGKEMFLANILAGIGEVTCLFGDVELNEEEHVKSMMLFLPQNLDLFTDSQKQKLRILLKDQHYTFFEIAFCNGNVSDIHFSSDPNLLNMYLEEQTTTKENKKR